MRLRGYPKALLEAYASMMGETVGRQEFTFTYESLPTVNPGRKVKEKLSNIGYKVIDVIEFRGYITNDMINKIKNSAKILLEKFIS